MSILVSCISTKHALLKQHWLESDRYTQAPASVRGSLHKPTSDLGGCLVLLNGDGEITAKVDLLQPSGMARIGDEILVASHTTVHSFSQDLKCQRPDKFTSKLFNALHTVRRSTCGILVTSTGLDLILEMDLQGRILWQWWAHDHGLDQTPLGRTRYLDRSADHRRNRFGTLQQTTHLNSAIESPDGRILTTLFHQNMVVAIDRCSGDWQTIITDLPHAHSVRLVDDRHFTVADTGHGRAILVDLVSCKVKAEVSIATSWLQDCQYDPAQDRWLLVDGEHSRIVTRSGDGDERVCQLDPEWRLYEALRLN